MTSPTSMGVSPDPIMAHHPGDAVPRARVVGLVAFSWGLCAFFPVGLMYLHLLLMTLAIGLSADRSARLRRVLGNACVLPAVTWLAWTLLAALVGALSDDLATRLFHVLRVLLVWALGMALWRREAVLALTGFLVGAVLAATIVAAHHLWGLPDWAIWRSLIAPVNNFSSGNMISMAVAAGLFFFLAIRQHDAGQGRWLAAAGAAALGLTVVLHAVSRNAQILLILAPMAAVLYRYRSLRATGLGLLLALALAAIAWQFSPQIQSRFAEVTSNLHAVTAEASYNSSIGIRWRMGQEAFEQMVAHPLFGTGVGSWLPHWKQAWAQMQPNLPAQEHLRFAEINNPHNDYLLAGMETGVPGMLLLGWTLARFIRLGWRSASPAGGILVVLAVAMAATAMVNAPLRDAALGMTLLWLMGVGVAVRRESAHG